MPKSQHTREEYFKILADRRKQKAINIRKRILKDQGSSFICTIEGVGGSVVSKIRKEMIAEGIIDKTHDKRNWKNRNFYNSNN